jgi:thyroxine 5-deiodinase
MMPMVVDSMDNLFDKNFGAWPFRFFIVHNNHLVYKPQPVDYSYDLKEARRWLQARFCK